MVLLRADSLRYLEAEIATLDHLIYQLGLSLDLEPSEADRLGLRHCKKDETIPSVDAAVTDELLQRLRRLLKEYVISFSNIMSKDTFSLLDDEKQCAVRTDLSLYETFKTRLIRIDQASKICPGDIHRTIFHRTLNRKGEDMSDPDAYTIGWISALDLEYTAAQEFFDDEHEGPSLIDRNDDNNYSLGRIGKHNVAMAVLPTGETGVAAAALAAKSMWHTFRNIRFCLMVGIGGGVPSDRHDIRLGDVVVSAPTFHIDSGNHGGVVQYDYGNSIRLGRFQSAKYLNQPPKVLRTALNGLRARYKRKGHQIDETITNVLTKNRRLRKEYSRPVPDIDTLHPFDSLRTEDDDDPMIHYGLIASADTFMEDAHARDTLSKELDVLCFEMEAAGLMNDFPCLVIRGICDYCDKDWSREWRGYAAMAAAALAKDLLQEVVPHQVHGEKTICEAMSHMQESLDLVHQTSSETKAEVKLLRSNQNMDKIERWMSPPNYSANVNHARELRQEGTGTWLLKSDSFEEWILGSRRHLWLHGLPGCGKTVLSSAIFDHVEKLDDRLTLTFFFDFADNTKQTLKTKEVDSLFKTHHDGRDHPGTKVLSDTLHAMIKIPDQKICIVLDAIDECTTRTALLNWMNQWFSMHDLDMIQLIATGRPEAEFQNCIPRWIGEANCVSLDKESINTDIHAYVSARLREGPEFKKWASFPSVKTQIRDEIGGKADGMFRWAACQLDHLESCLDREGIETALKSLPRDLNETYHRILENIPQERKTMAIRLLQFLVYSERPLTVAEAIDVVAVRINEGQRGVLSRGLTVNAQGGEYGNALQAASYGGHREIVQLLMDNGADVNAQGGMFGNALQAASYGGHREIVQLLMKHGVNINFQFGNYGYSLQAASYRGHQEIVQLLMNNGADVRAQGGQYGNALQAASYGGHPEIVQLLMDNGADINARDGEYGNALQAASYGGHREIMQLLMDNGADVNAQGGQYGDALQAASDRGDQEIVQLLMDNCANVNAQGGQYGNALQAASYGGHPEIVQLLMDIGADVDAQGGQYGNALQAASYGGYREIVQLLMDNGADVNAQGGQYGNALQAASRGGYRGQYGNALQAASEKGYSEIVQLLMDNGADVNAQGGQYGNALQAASYGGYREIVQLLMDNGADVNAQGGLFGNALHAAVRERHEDVVCLLLQNGCADPSITDERGWTALHVVCEVGDLKLAKILLNAGADAVASDHSGWTPCHVAAGLDRVELVALLLSHMAVNALQRDHSGGIPAFYTAVRNGLDVLDAMLTEDMDLGTAEDRYVTGDVTAAKRNSHTDFSKPLPLTTHQMNSVDIFGRSIIYWAEQSGDPELLATVTTHASQQGFQSDQRNQRGDAQCYWMDGTISDSVMQPCNPDAAVSACCGLNKERPDICLSSGLCYAQDTGFEGFIYANGCTDQTGQDEKCPHFCTDRQECLRNANIGSRPAYSGLQKWQVYNHLYWNHRISDKHGLDWGCLIVIDGDNGKLSIGNLWACPYGQRDDQRLS
ncbi:Cytoplasmic 60S subunit biogenesis factor REI1 [Purpureocillium lavendulum]|uniref:Cytoplasmic 60S subunit biogenesis factor REI1 n=1 Tax=Purpureocillium lavendulum TaxID=1247861 RepID=A0AB34FJG3_9HYPO|nr:Cytoplasmic 60S subunit biogenesis factor REI1 [Purpureocillium lavendulum]